MADDPVLEHAPPKVGDRVAYLGEICAIIARHEVPLAGNFYLIVPVFSPTDKQPRHVWAVDVAGLYWDDGARCWRVMFV